MALVRDPMFWKRFSRAVHLDEEAKAAAGGKNNSNSNNNHSDNWIQAQYRKKRRSIICGFFIFLAIASLVAGIIVVLLWLNSRHWLQPQRHST
ncbi:uncharacterized protein ACLA_065860 [Aspergillus clavatus NRRL 1]|uniref:Uncharacterized protein n=1 Tax=Aspergillus clavatus (strain ATCC 1007 / CBS 513.65 / DSM 816 / NCTC 3887 / NRRL 1 / QM 1276 / 107) TaxID=344612 RepID=A1CG72_ASPCL|nr:uncharacterized protein ACLA_065860 [Aspergillus clavatus NRRL 1]EAW10952.1 conserved hypothetical protein [Aspergillus clavatus NRRL 1]